jgi:hypothetical protein
LEAAGWTRERIGELSFARPLQPTPLAIAVFTLRPGRAR